MKCLHLLRLVCLLAVLMASSSCEEFLNIHPPKEQLASATVYSTDPEAALRGLYSTIMSEQTFGGGNLHSLYLLMGLSSDELVHYNVANRDRGEFYHNTITPTNSYVLNNWRSIYKYIYYSNSILAGLELSTDALSESDKSQFEGEAKFIRAFCYFYLTNLWGDVPLLTSTDYRKNSTAFRTPKFQVYEQIIQDLEDAQYLMHSDYRYSDNERIRPNSWAATALLARVCLFTGDWENAEKHASAVIGNTQMFGLVNNLDNVFLKNSTEAIWQLLPVWPGYNTQEARYFILSSIPNIASLSNQLIVAFEPGDLRRAAWVGTLTIGENTYYYPYKYKIRAGTVVDEYLMVFRLSEQYLVRAEARAQRNDITGARRDINSIRNRAGLPNTTADTQTELLRAIERERQVELFTEWGHRWLDLKRTDRVNAVMEPIKPDWNAYSSLFPIPELESEANPNLADQPRENQ